MTDPISTLRGLCQDSKRRDDELRRSFSELEKTLAAATEGVDVRGRSDDCSLETCDDEAVYGHLFFGRSVLKVAYRSTEDDLYDALNNDGDPTFSVTKPQECCAVWLRALAAPTIIESLLKSLAGAARTSIGLNYHVVLEDWRRAQSALGVDPPDATATNRTIKAEKDCEGWLVGLMMNKGPKEKSKLAFFEEAKDNFNIPKRAFDRAWGNAITKSGNPDWSKAGRRKKS